jgi:hypothetical protein
MYLIFGKGPELYFLSGSAEFTVFYYTFGRFGDIHRRIRREGGSRVGHKINTRPAEWRDMVVESGTSNERWWATTVDHRAGGSAYTGP